ncbi:DNA polymerase I [Candidatus Bipolaricaulota sp. J31]
MTLYDLLGVKEVPERLLLIDGHSALFRSFYALPELTTSKGMPVNAIYGFTRTLLMALREYPSKYVVVAFDAKGPTLRHAAYAEYKATRKEMPDPLKVQLPVVKELVDVFGLKRLELEGYEADDIMATLSKLAEKRGIPVLNLTGDKDMAQLVSDKVFILKPGRRPTDRLELLDRKGIEERYGVPPERIVDLLALVGDPIDNVPGVKGIGEKTAKKLLQQYGSLEAVLQAAERIPNKRVAEALRAHREEALLSRELVRLKEAPLEISLEECAPAPLDTEALLEFLGKLEFFSIIKELGLEARYEELREKRTAGEPKPVYKAILDESALEALIGRLKEAEEFALDLETTGTDPFSAEIVGIALAVSPYEGFYIPVGHRYLGAPSQLSLDHVLEKLKPLLEDEGHRVIGQNLKYDMEVLSNYGIELRGISFDAMIAHWLLNPDAPSHALEVIAQEVLGERMRKYKELLAVGGERGMEEVPVERATAYAAADAEVITRLAGPLREKLEENGLKRLYEEVELPLIEVLAWMERRGVLLDVEVLQEQAKELEVMLSQLREELYELAGSRFNPNSTPQVREILYERLKLPVIAKTKTGPSTDAQVLRELSRLHEFPAKLLAYRELEKLRNTYVEKLPQYVHPKTGRIHTSFNQTGTATGRLSSSEPNLQNIPLREGLIDIRRAFVAPKGRVLIGADYSQIELRVLAHLSGDENLIETFRKGEDLHRRTAAEIFGVPPEAVDERMRSVAKRVNFGIVYGITPYGLARDQGIPQEEAKKFIERFFAAYPKVKEFIDRVVREVEERGYAETILGRKRWIQAPGGKLVGAARRNAINAPVQGSAADIMKLAMLRCHRLWKEGKLPAEMILQVHDELIFEVDESAAEEAGRIIREAMEGVYELAAPLKVDIKVGRNWAEL